MAIETISWVYQLSDFDTSGANITPPDERGARAQGNPPFNITLSAGSSAQEIELNDGSNDGLDEINSANQLLTQPITLDGVTYGVGTRILVNYVLEDASGFKMYSITLGANNTGNNATTAVITNGPIVPGQQYTFTSEGNVGNGEVDYTDITCFADGTSIRTTRGERKVETLKPNDLIIAHDGRVLTLRLILKTSVTASSMAANNKLRPVRISAGALGCGLPRKDLLVSRQHRMLVSSKIAERMFGVTDVLISAIKLTELPGIFVDADVKHVGYHHLVFDEHEVIIAEGAPTESLFTGAEALKAMSQEVLEELWALYPQLKSQEYSPRPAQHMPCGQLQKQLVARHVNNQKPVLAY